MTEFNDRARDVVVVILGGGRGARLEPLTRDRSKPAVPIAGKYRLIDIPISNAIHSEMQRILVLTQYNSVSLHRHIGLTYKFDPFSRGYVQILAAQQTPGNEQWFQGTADAVRQNLRIIAGLQGDLVLVLSGDHMYRMDYRAMLREHLDRQADITLAVLPCSPEEIAEFGAVRVDAQARVLEFREKPRTPEARAGMEASPKLLAREGVDESRPYLASMGIYLFRKDVLLDCLDNDLADFGRHVIPASVERRRIQAFFFDGYWRDIGTIRAFYDTHMDLVQPSPPFDFNDVDWPIYTRPRYLPAARVDGCRFVRSILAEGSTLVESELEDSVIGIGTVMRRATVRRSFVMGADQAAPEPPPGAPAIGIGEDTVIEGAIVDRNARVGKGVRMLQEGRAPEGRGNGWVIHDGVVVVTRNAVIPDGTTIA